jgi:predicted glycoside hydrolase/deacetylase ChbG (UPF0249 family)
MIRNSHNTQEASERSESARQQSAQPELRDPSIAKAAATTCSIAETGAVVIVNADDWGVHSVATDRILECILHRVVSSVSAMVFMADSERAAAIAAERDIDAGIHLNLTEPFSATNVPDRLVVHQEKIAKFLRSSRFAPVSFHPLLTSSFEYVVKAQLDEFERLYGAPPHRLDGHHHAHLCANVQWQKLLPAGTIVRRNFTFNSGEKGGFNRLYRRMQDGALARKHRTTDYFFNLAPIDRERLRPIVELGRHFNVEIETHPERPAEHRFLMDGELLLLSQDVTVACGYLLRARDAAPNIREVANETAAEISTKSSRALPHISVCICTYKRPAPLKRLLKDLNRQSTAGLFTYSIVVADNDASRSGEVAVNELRLELAVPINYCVEPQRGIARARNKVMENAEGDFVALIDDDEFPIRDWLLNLFKTCKRYGVDGVLGPVRRYFDEEPPMWLKKSSLFDRAVNPTGMQVEWRGARTGNALLKRAIFVGDPAPFCVDFKAGEDQDFFRRKIEEGRSFVWSAEATAYEVLPPARWKRSYYVRKALLQGAAAARQPDCGIVSIAKSMIAVPLYAIGLPFALLAGQHRFMTLLVKLCDHAGKLLSLIKINPIREEYVSD